MLILLWILSDDEKDIVSEIFTQYHGRLYNISFQILHSQQDAEDAVEQTFLKIMNKIEQIKSIPCHERLPFCVIVLKNAAIDIQRKNVKTIPVEDIDEIGQRFSDSTEKTFFQNYDRELLLQQIQKLSIEDRYLLELKWGEDMAYKEIGALMNITESTARKRLQRALNKLQKLYIKEGHVNV